MRQVGRVTVTMQELDRRKCIEAVVEGSRTPIRAAESHRALQGHHRAAMLLWKAPRKEEGV
jgi:hypothetical protein